MAKCMQAKESIAGITWLVLLIIAGGGGLVRFLMDVRQGKAKLPSPSAMQRTSSRIWMS